MRRLFAMVWSTYFFSELGRSMYFILITWALYQQTKDASYTGLLVGLGFLPSLFLNLAIGVFVDRLNRKRLAQSANILAITCILFLFFSFQLQLISPWMIIIVHMLLQVAGSLLRPSLQAWMAEIFTKQELPKVYTSAGAAGEIGALLGASIAGLLLAYFPSMLTIIIVLLTYILAALSLFLLPNSMHHNITQHSARQSSFIEHFTDGVRYLRRHSILHQLLSMMFIGQLVFHTSIAFLSIYTAEYLNETAKIYGFLEATISIGGIIAGILGTWW